MKSKKTNNWNYLKEPIVVVANEVEYEIIAKEVMPEFRRYLAKNQLGDEVVLFEEDVIMIKLETTLNDRSCKNLKKYYEKIQKGHNRPLHQFIKYKGNTYYVFGTPLYIAGFKITDNFDVIDFDMSYALVNTYNNTLIFEKDGGQALEMVEAVRDFFGKLEYRVEETEFSRTSLAFKDKVDYFYAEIIRSVPNSYIFLYKDFKNWLKIFDIFRDYSVLSYTLIKEVNGVYITPFGLDSPDAFLVFALIDLGRGI